MHTQHLSKLAAAIAILGWHLAPGPAAAQVAITPVAVSGGTAPAGGTYSSFGTSVLNANGQVAFAANLTGGSSTQGLFAGTPGSLQPVALQGSVAPAGGTYSSLYGPVLTATGQIAFTGNLTGGSATQGLFAGTLGSVQAIALQGAAAPAGGNYVNLYGPALNSSGKIAFYATLSGGSAGSGLFAGAPGSVQAVAVQGGAAPAGGTYGGFSLTAGPVLNTSGQVAFFATVTGGSSSQGFFAGTAGAVQAVALQGDAAPAGGTYINFGAGPLLNTSGQVAFYAGLTGGSSSSGLFVGAPGSLQAAALTGSAAPAGGSYSGFGAGGNLNHSGQVAFTAFLTGGSANSGLFVGTPGSLHATALDGMLAPAGNGATFTGNFSSTLNDSGQVAFSSLLSGPAVVTDNNRGLYASSPGGLVEIVRKGDMIDFGNGSGLHTVSNIGFATPYGSDDGNPLSFNGSGLLVYELSFTDGTSGIFTSQITSVPEPGTPALTAAALAGICLRRRRGKPGA